MKRILILLLLINSLIKADERNISLIDFASIVSSQNNVNIYIDEDLKKQNVSIFVPFEIDDNDLLYVFKNSLKKLGYELELYNKIYYTIKKESDSLYSYFINLKYNSFDNVSNYLKFKEIKYQYIDTINTFVVYAPANIINSVSNDIRKIDSEKKQVTLRFTIIEINNDELNEQGFTHSTIYESATGEILNVLNTFVLPFQTNKPIFTSPNFYATLKLFNENKFFNISQNPFILVQDNKDFTFQAVSNIPYQSSKTITQATNVSQQTSIEYKDVGLKISGKSIVFDDYINLDLDLVIEDILSTTDNIPTTYKRQLKSNTNLKYGEVLILSGINQTKVNKTDFNIPFFSSIPYLGELFKYKSESNIKSNISIAIEVIK